jgi:Tfp pilus assembly protein PilV
MRHGEAGFTLVEFIAAATLLTFGLLSVATLLMTAITLNSLGKNTNEAFAQARAKVEDLKMVPESDPQRAVGGSVSSDIAGYNDTRGIYHRRWQVVSGPSGTRVYTIRVEATKGDQRTQQPVTVTTIF